MVKPIRNRPVYRWIDPARPNRRPIITQKHVAESGGREPDAALYRFDVLRCCWILKEYEGEI